MKFWAGYWSLRRLSFGFVKSYTALGSKLLPSRSGNRTPREAKYFLQPSIHVVGSEKPAFFAGNCLLRKYNLSGSRDRIWSYKNKRQSSEWSVPCSELHIRLRMLRKKSQVTYTALGLAEIVPTGTFQVKYSIFLVVLCWYRDRFYIYIQDDLPYVFEGLFRCCVPRVVNLGVFTSVVRVVLSPIMIIWTFLKW